MIKKMIFTLGFFTTLLFGASFEDAQKAQEKGDYKKVLSIYEDLAKKGDADAQYILGSMYLHRDGIKQDFEKAKEWFKKGCDGGDQDACMTLKSF